ncbi:DUF4450 domain-containing protein [Tellurirhabdus bombi]|uniref:DUF4450 domain-containing protein n=1 Tax=Tellurirhabdus bombi TaxID=2907205 RepID=UPI001F3DEA3B|nr:DUF4450 domain-containing protein [Tellurirhabdus bombi]
MRKTTSIISLLLLSTLTTFSQSTKPSPVWHNQERTLHYRPDGEDFVTINGKRRFNRALYGTNTAFRAEAGDLPEFALYLPGVGGTLRFGLAAGGRSKWLMDAEKITARYRPGSMLYEIEDAMLGKGKLHLTVLAMADAEGLLVKAAFEGVPTETVKLVWGFGGITGKKLNRDGDIGADPESSFYLKPENCVTNNYELNKNSFRVFFGAAPTNQVASASGQRKSLIGVMPPSSQLHVADASRQETPQAFALSDSSKTLALAGSLSIRSQEPLYFAIQVPGERQILSYEALPDLLQKAEQARKTLAGQVKLKTPDPYINTLGGALSVAADAIWESPTFLHGSVAWRMRLNGWRGPYAGDPLGWHDRSRAHFRAYAKSQLTSPEVGPIVADTALNMARHLEKLGTAVFSSGYICRNPNGDFRPHHYDMNLVYIDELLWHFNWTGDVEFIREMWPVLKRHLDWEKRNFDIDGDGLYDAYCCIWASDALQYSGGGVTHSSAYNYRANKMAARLAAMIGEDPEPYRKEADKILQALNNQLWMPKKGWYAEFKDLLGLKQLHPSAGLWTVYHAIDSDVPDAFRAYQTLRYVDTEIPRIPIQAKGLADEGYYTISTTNWMPYDWSLNNVALAEVLHTSLAYWQAGQTEEAYKLWKSALVESMYVGSSPGNFQQLSFYDANRGELYRDFADPIGVASRTVVEGLFGIIPNATEGKLTIKPGFPDSWNEASLHITDVAIDFQRQQKKDRYTIIPRFGKALQLTFQVKAQAEGVKSVTINGEKVSWQNVPSAIGKPILEIKPGSAEKYEIEIEWEGTALQTPVLKNSYAQGASLTANFPKATLEDVFDPQETLQNVKKGKNNLQAQVAGERGNRTAFVQLRQGAFTWWAPLAFEVDDAVAVLADTEPSGNELIFRVQNHTDEPIQGHVTVNTGKNAFNTSLTIPARGVSSEIRVPAQQVRFGSNRVVVEWAKGKTAQHDLINWNVTSKAASKLEKLAITNYFNDRVTNLFKNDYVSPRPTSPTLQLPEQGIGNWCYPLTDAVLDDSGLRRLAGTQNEIKLPSGVPLQTPNAAGSSNILFVSQWDNYPAEAAIPLSGRASHAYFLMAGSSNTMQSQFTNGELLVAYTDGTEEVLTLRNPETWWPIEQDYYTDGFAFQLKKPVPYRVHLKTGLITRQFDQYTSIKGFSTRAIEGGAATVLDLPLNPTKTLKALTLKALANDVVIGLMSVTLVRE